jgi:hypothetical protein
MRRGGREVAEEGESQGREGVEVGEEEKGARMGWWKSMGDGGV